MPLSIAKRVVAAGLHGLAAAHAGLQLLEEHVARRPKDHGHQVMDLQGQQSCQTRLRPLNSSRTWHEMACVLWFSMVFN